MSYTAQEVLQFVRDNDVKFARMAFCDLVGTQKHFAVMTDQLESAFEHGVALRPSSLVGYSDMVKTDLLLRPDPATLKVLPWRRSRAASWRFYCNISYRDGHAVFSASRADIAKGRRPLHPVCCCAAPSARNVSFTSSGRTKTAIPRAFRTTTAAIWTSTARPRRKLSAGRFASALRIWASSPKRPHHENGRARTKSISAQRRFERSHNFLTFKTVVKRPHLPPERPVRLVMPKPIPEKFGNGLHVNFSLYRERTASTLLGHNAEDQLISQQFMRACLSAPPK
jgi:glutamine synthetase